MSCSCHFDSKIERRGSYLSLWVDWDIGLYDDYVNVYWAKRCDAGPYSVTT